MAQKCTPALTGRDVATCSTSTKELFYRLAQRVGLPGFTVAGTWRLQGTYIQSWIQHWKKFSTKRVSKVVYETR